MFEKEAKEYTKENLCKECHHHCTEGICTCTECKKKTFKDGAEFGYNKAIVEIKDAYEGNGNFLAWFENYLEGKNV